MICGRALMCDSMLLVLQLNCSLLVKYFHVRKQQIPSLDIISPEVNKATCL